MRNEVLLFTISVLLLGLSFTIYAIFFDTGEMPGDTPEGDVEEPKRARNEKGQLKADDKSTPNVNEAWEGGVAPKRKRGRPKGSKNKPKNK